MDITNSNLEAAIIDQKVAGEFQGKRYAFAAVVATGGWQLGVAVLDEPGYHPVDGKSFAKQAEAKEWANGLNSHIGLSEEAALNIIITTLRGRRAGAAR